MSSTTLCVLLAPSQEVLCISNDVSFKINFPVQAFPPFVTRPYIPSGAPPRTSIVKIVSCEDIGTTVGLSSGSQGLVSGTDSVFAALTAYGDVFTWSPGQHLEQSNQATTSVKPQRVWALKKQMGIVKVGRNIRLKLLFF
jgi:hypothetical protein